MVVQSFVEALFDEKFPLRGALAAGKNHRVHTIHIAGRAHEHMFDADSREHRAVRLEISLNGEYADFHASLHCSFSIKPPVLSVAFLRALWVKFRKARHRDHNDSTRTTEKLASI